MPNRLATETSPYLRQHAENPVDWYPWGPEALGRAKAEGRPILLSIGYSACHWCHVMERESFADAEVAAAMNARFVNIKVDREERPDLDDLYMQAVQAFSGGHGGWPMTLFLTPDGAPFFGGTYFPPEPRHGLPSFRQVLDHVDRVWREQRDRVQGTAAQVVALLAQSGQMPERAATLGEDWLDAVAGAADDAYDAEHGGFGGQPKFPPHGTLDALLAHWRRTGRARSLELVRGTLDGMMRGGMYDLLGGGFCRYSVDAEWRVPHFEKMLLDNALLAPVYADAWRITGEARYARVARETLDYVLRDLRVGEDPARFGLAASEDADSEGGEGAFYAWTPEEVCGLLGIDDGIQACLLLGITQHGTFERGTSVLRTETFPEELPEERRALFEDALRMMRVTREDRLRPARDHKVVAAFNGHALGALARVGAALGEARYLAAAEAVARHLLEVQTVGGRLMRVHTDGVASVPAFAEDHAAVGLGLLELWEATFDPRWLRASLELADRTVALFWDEADGGLCFTGHDAEALVARSKRLVGGAEPAGNDLAAWWFARLHALCGREDLREKADRILRALQGLLQKAPRALGPSVLAAGMLTGRVREVGIVGGAEASAPLLAEVRRRYDPFRVLARLEPGADPSLVPWMAGKSAQDGAPTAYVCEGGTCLAPTTDPAALGAQLDASERPERAARVGGARVRAPELPQDPTLWLNAAAPPSIAGLRGQVVVLDFWTTCCINCMHVLPVLERIEARFAGEPVVVLGVHSSKFPAERERPMVARALERYGVRHPVVLDADHAVWDEYAVRSWPTIVVVDTSGRVAWHRSGEVREEELAEVVDRLVREGREQGTAGAAGAWRADPAPREGALSFPGKLAMYPGFVEQAQGVDPFGPAARLYIADSGHHRILEARLERDAEGWPVAHVVRTFGDGTPGADDGPAPRFRGPQGLARRGDTLFVADTENQRLRAIDLRTGEARTLMGTGELGRAEAINPAEPLTQHLRSPWDVTAAPDVLFVAMAGAHQVWLYMEQPVRAGPFIGSGDEAHADGDPAQAALAQPSGIQVHGQYLFWVDAETSSVRLLNMATREVGTVVGKDLFDFGDADGAPKDVLLQHPLGLTVAEATVYVADTYNHKIKAIDMSDGARTRTLAGGPEVFTEPSDLDVAGPFLLVADTGRHRVRAVNRHTGEVRTVLLKGAR